MKKKLLAIILILSMILTLFAGQLVSVAAESQVDAVINRAKSLLGSTAYNGYCQSFVWYCYQAAGIDASKATARKAWEAWGISTRSDNIPRGACVYYNDTDAGHVGLYIGDNKMIHASKTLGGVVETDIRGSWYTSRYLGWGWNGGVALSDVDTNVYDDYYKLTAPDGFQSLRSSASTSATELARIPAGTIVNVTKYNSDKSWGYLTYEGKSGWIRLYYVQKTEKPHTHAYNSTWTKDSTYHWKVCTGCGNVGNKSTHTWNSGSITKQPNCNNTGTKTYTCTVCGATKTETIAKNSNHNFVNGKCSVCGLTNRKDFPDVTYTAWYGDSVAYAVGSGLMTGYASGKFGTSDGIQRQDFVVILARLSGANLNAYKGQKAFKDVDPNAYYAPALAWAKANGVSSGYNDGSFGVGRKVTREQIMTFLHNYAVLKNYDVTVTDAEKAQIRAQYSDFKNVSSYAQEATYWALKNGVISGKEVNGKRYISPSANAQRCEVAAMFYNINENNIFA